MLEEETLNNVIGSEEMLVPGAPAVLDADEVVLDSNGVIEDDKLVSTMVLLVLPIERAVD